MKREIVRRAFAGEKFTDLNIIDSHCHMGPTHNFYFPRAEIDEMIYDADIVGIRRICIAPHVAISSDYRLGNKQVAEAAKKYPDRVYGLLTLNANKHDEVELEFETYYKSNLFAGVKLHPGFHNYRVTSENCEIIYENVLKYGGYILCHTWDRSDTCSVELCEIIIKEYPRIPFVLGHGGGRREGIEKSIRVVNKYENAYMDTSGFEFSDVWIEDIVKKADNTKILFGSDYPYHDIRGGVSRILLADIDDDVKLMILGNNYSSMLTRLSKN